MKNNMERLVKELQERFGEEYEVVSVKVPKNKEVLDGFQISRRCTGYGIIFYPDFERGARIAQICQSVWKSAKADGAWENV